MRAFSRFMQLFVVALCASSTALSGTKLAEWVHQYVVTEAYKVVR